MIRQQQEADAPGCSCSKQLTPRPCQLDASGFPLIVARASSTNRMILPTDFLEEQPSNTHPLSSSMTSTATAKEEQSIGTLSLLQDSYRGFGDSSTPEDFGDFGEDLNRDGRRKKKYELQTGKDEWSKHGFTFSRKPSIHMLSPPAADRTLLEWGPSQSSLNDDDSINDIANISIKPFDDDDQYELDLRGDELSFSHLFVPKAIAQMHRPLQRTLSRETAGTADATAAVTVGPITAAAGRDKDVDDGCFSDFMATRFQADDIESVEGCHGVEFGAGESMRDFRKASTTSEDCNDDPLVKDLKKQLCSTDIASQFMQMQQQAAVEKQRKMLRQVASSSSPSWCDDDAASRNSKGDGEQEKSKSCRHRRRQKYCNPNQARSSPSLKELAGETVPPNHSPRSSSNKAGEKSSDHPTPSRSRRWKSQARHWSTRSPKTSIEQSAKKKEQDREGLLRALSLDFNTLSASIREQQRQRLQPGFGVNLTRSKAQTTTNPDPNAGDSR